MNFEIIMVMINPWTKLFKKKIFVKNVFAKYFLSAVRSFAIYFENGIIMGHLT